MPKSRLLLIACFRMETNTNNNPPAGDLRPNIYAALIITLVLAVAAVALRFLARRLVKIPLWLDDWLTLVSLVCTTLSTASPKIDSKGFQGYYTRL